MIYRAFLALVVVTASAPGCAPALHARPRVDPTLYSEPPANAITFWGHACAYIDVGGFGIVTDPVFMGTWAVIRRRLIPVPPPEAYDQTRVVLISHAHHDHLDPKALARFSPNTVILAPAPAAKYLLRRGIRAHVMRPGSEYRIPGGTIVAVPACHPGERLSFKARADGRALGYVIRMAKVTIYYSGDTEYFPELASIGSEHRPDIALLNVNRHLHSHDAILAVAELGMPVVIPAHNGAYSGPSARRASRWRGELMRALGPTVVPLEVGESMRIPGSVGDAAAPFATPSAEDSACIVR
jgi:L-ascorbate metabolism protein UlaG (beta-lactamase superfamily)